MVTTVPTDGSTQAMPCPRISRIDQVFFITAENEKLRFALYSSTGEVRMYIGKCQCALIIARHHSPRRPFTLVVLGTLCMPPLIHRRRWRNGNTDTCAILLALLALSTIARNRRV